MIKNNIEVDVKENNVVEKDLNKDEKQKTNGFAVASLLLGIGSLIGFYEFVLPPILAIVFGILGRKSAVEKNQKGKKRATVGIVLGILYTFECFAMMYLRVNGLLM